MGKKNGVGKFIFSNGNTYEGEFDNDIINGYVFIKHFLKLNYLTF